MNIESSSGSIESSSGSIEPGSSSGPVVMKTYRILVTGSRDWDDADVVCKALGDAVLDVPIDHEIVIVHGACPRGADKIAHDWAVRHGYIIEAHAALWSQWGPGAGPRRNAEMVSAGADVCLAFVKDESRGAVHTATLAARAGIVVRRTDQEGSFK